MWGNCWEWTATEITATRGEGRDPHHAYATVGFRIVKETK